MKMPEAIGSIQVRPLQGDEAYQTINVVWHKRTSEIAGNIYSEAQLREAVQYAANAKTEWPADEAISYLHGYAKGYDFFEAELKQLQEQNTAIDAKLATNEAVMKQALLALESAPDTFTNRQAIKALEDALK